MPFAGNTVVTLYAGPDKTMFQVHGSILFDASSVFKAAFSTNFKEASEQIMTLPDDDTESVERMIQWLYDKTLNLTDPTCEVTSAEWYMQLAKLNTLAEKYDIYRLQNDIVDEVFDTTNTSKTLEAPPIPCVQHVYENTTRKSAFRKLMVAWYTHILSLEWYQGDTIKDELADTPQDFAVDMAIELGLRLKDPNRKSAFELSKSPLYVTFPSAPLERSDGEHTEQESSKMS